MRILIETIPRHQMRYATDGDWFRTPNGTLYITVPDDLPPWEAWLIALHELVEVQLCDMRGITEKQVDAFDFAFTGEGEPGDAPDSPYRKEHRQACIIEHMAANMLGLTNYGTVA